MTEKQIKRCVARWQKELKLHVWRIRVFVEPTLEAQGRVYWEAQLFDATILIRPLHPMMPGEKRAPIEKTIIHELLHLHFAPLGDPCPKRVEDSVDAMAWALYKARQIVKQGLSAGASEAI